MSRVWARLKEHWIRHLLAAVQVAVGVAVVAAVFVDIVPALRASTSTRTAETFSAIYGGSTPFSSFRSSVFTIDDIEYLTAQSDSVVAASIYDSSFTTLVRVDGDLYMLRGLAKVSPDFPRLVDMPLIAGRFFDDSEVQVDEPQVAVISSDLARTLFPGREAIGQTINIRPESEAGRIAGLVSPFDTISTEGNPGLDVRVIGVFEYPEGTPVFTGFLSDMPRAELFIPATGRHSRALTGAGIVSMPADSQPPVDLPPSQAEYMQLFFRTTPGTGDIAIAEVEALLLPRLEGRRPASGMPDDTPNSLIISEATSGAEMLRRSQMTGTLILGAMGIAALIVSGVSIFTTFLASVAERVRAIGLARALGATRLRILREVVGEAVALSAFGGLLGVALSFPVRFVALKSLLSTLSEPPGAIDYLITIGFALLLAMAVGGVASLYPGWTVARMMPAEAFFEE